MSILEKNLKNPKLREIFHDDGSVNYPANSGGAMNSLVFHAKDGGNFSLDAVHRHLNEYDFNDESDRQWFIIDYSVYEEGRSFECDLGDGDVIESMYGPVED